jgi:hypothetical protein
VAFFVPAAALNAMMTLCVSCLLQQQQDLIRAVVGRRPPEEDELRPSG